MPLPTTATTTTTSTCYLFHPQRMQYTTMTHRDALTYYPRYFRKHRDGMVLWNATFTHARHVIHACMQRFSASRLLSNRTNLLKWASVLQKSVGHVLTHVITPVGCAFDFLPSSTAHLLACHKHTRRGATMGKTHLMRGVGRMADLVMTKAQGSWVYTADQRKLLDFTSGIAVTSLGHCHPRVVEATQRQVATLVHAQVNLGYHAPMLELSDRLLPKLPQGLDSLFFSTTGSEAVENAVKLARHATKKPNVIVFQGGYHGRTLGAVSLTTSKTIYRAGYGPLMSGVTVVPFPYPTHGPIFEEEPCGQWCLDQIKLALKQQTAPSETAAVLIEPVLGEGGYVVPPKSFMKGLRKICDENNMLLIADEVQSGYGRTGEFFAIDGHFDVVPDVLVMAKGIANGFPLSAIASRKELSDSQPPGSVGGTYAGNAVSCAAALATLDVIEDENVLANVNKRGAEFMTGLQKLKGSGRYPILDVRGLGLMVALEFDLKQAPVGTAARVSEACLKHGMMVLTTSTFETLRFMPPLTISADETRLGLELLERALEDTFSK